MQVYQFDGGGVEGSRWVGGEGDKVQGGHINAWLKLCYILYQYQG